MGFSGRLTSWGWALLTWGPFSVAIRLAMAVDVVLFVENGLNRVLVSNRGWEGWGNLPGRWLMTVAGVGSGGGDRQCAGCSGNATGVVGGSKVVTWQRWN
jgi:hypothetical protein